MPTIGGQAEANLKAVDGVTGQRQAGRRAAVLGSPVGHSLSPVLHRAAYGALGLPWRYDAIECDEAGLAGWCDRVRGEAGWAGLSLTMPLKTAALALLDEVDGQARAVGALNTVVVETGTEPGGPARLSGYNTDIDGIRYAVEQALGVLSVPRRSVVLGAGGTARAAVAALCRLGAGSVDVVARRPDAAASLIDIGAETATAVSVLPWYRLDDGILTGSDLVVATTPAGATDDLAARRWPAGAALVELLYHPWPTPLAARAAADGASVVGGMAVLAAQAVGQVALFTGAKVDVGVLLAAGEAALATRHDLPQA